MKLTLQTILQERGLTRYRLSKDSGIPWATLADICSGKTRLDRCSAGTVMKLAAALQLPVEDVLKLEMKPVGSHTGKPTDTAYLETNLPPDLQKAIAEYVQGIAEHSSLLDCLWGEVYGSINAHMWGGDISEEHAKHLRAKYLFDEEQEDVDD